ncbi:MAG: redoxin domain-containing protein [Clostridia bacterium]|nr:redoxin domain-containing protein [Clostridia bacterium]
MKKILEKLKTISRKTWLISGISVGCAALILVGCLVLIPGKDKPETPDAPAGATTTATITVTNRLDAPVADAQVYVYEDSTLTELATFAKTDAEGKATVTLSGADNVAVLKGTAPGYKVEEYYPLDGDTAIVLDALASYETIPSDAKIDMGDPMMDFTFTDLDGVSHTASEVLKEKKALVLNFWFTTCDPCAAEFPYLQKAYDAHKDDVALLAVNPYETDTEDKIKAFREDKKLTIPMADIDTVWASVMNISAYPTTVVIDRYGFVAFYHVGTVTEEGVFEKLFKYYTAEDYAHTVASDVSELSLPEEAPKEDEEGLIYDNKSEPIEFGSVLTFDAKIPAGKTTYYNVYRVSGTVLSLKADNVTVEYNGKTYEPKDGVISFPVSTDDVTIPVNLAITNTGDKTATFTVDFDYPAGTLDNPIALEMGSLTTNVEKGNDQGVFYEYKATANGTVTMYVESITKGVKYGFSLYNMNTSAMRNSDEDATGSKKSVSITVNKGDVVQVTVSVLPDEKHEYPAATIKSKISFKAGAGANSSTVKKNVTYKVTVKSGKTPVSGVKLTFTVDGKSKSATTTSKGIATASLPTGDCLVKMTCPKGYIAETLQYRISSSSPTLIINLEKEEELSTDVGETPTDYSVKVVDGNGKAQKNVTVSFYLGDKKVKSVKTNSKGIAAATMMDGSYTVKLTGTTLKYDKKAAVVTASNPAIEILLAKAKGTEKERIECPVVGAARAAYVVTEGATYLDGLRPGERNYFLFTPERSGQFRISTTGTYAKVGYYGGSVHYIVTTNMAEGAEPNAFTVEVRDVGVTFVIGVDAATNIDSTVLSITRVGDPGWSPADEPWHVYKNTHTPKQYKLPSGTTLKNMDITKSYKLVYNSTDGYYHKDTKDGPIVYLRFAGDVPYVAFADILTNFHISAYLYDAAGNFLKKEEYTESMTAYNDCVDAKENVYPLTKDLEYVIKQYGKQQGWWDPESPGYLFEDEDGNPLPNVNLDTGWMFALCYAD